MTADVLRRLRPVLSGMPAGELEDLARSIARRRHRWEQQDIETLRGQAKASMHATELGR